MNKIRKKFDIDKLYDMGVRGQNTTVAILDTGINIKHPDLKDCCVAFYDAVNRYGRIYDDNGHGTHIAGIIAGRGRMLNGKYRGIAPECKVVSIKILNSKGKGRMCNIRDGIRWILENRKKYNISFVNMSVGATDSEETEESELVKLVEMMWDAGITVIAAAGNNGPEINSVSSPGISRKIITVGAYDDDRVVHTVNGKNMVNYSGRGPTGACIVKPEIVAPGHEIVSCCINNNLYDGRSGTSMATPVVTGIAVLFKSIYPEISPKNIKKMMHNTAYDLGFEKNRQGWGMINLQKYMLRE